MTDPHRRLIQRARRLLLRVPRGSLYQLNRQQLAQAVAEAVEISTLLDDDLAAARQWARENPDREPLLGTNQIEETRRVLDSLSAAHKRLVAEQIARGRRSEPKPEVRGSRDSRGWS